MTDTLLMRTYKYRAFRPRAGREAFDLAVNLKRSMWADLCDMNDAQAREMAPLLAAPKAERDAGEIARLKAERTAAIADIRRAYAAKGLAWGDYNAVVFQFAGAVQSAGRRGAAPSPNDEALGEAVVRQIMNGARPHHLLSRSDACLEYLPPSHREQTRRPGSHRAKYRTARLTFMVRSSRSTMGEAPLVLDFVMHRPLPMDASVVEVRVIRRQRPVIDAGGSSKSSERWFVTFAFKLPAKQSASRAAVGVALDWKGDGNGGANLAVVADRRGVRTIGFPEAHIDAWGESRRKFDAADAEPDAATRAAMQAEAIIFRRRLAAERQTILRTMAREIVAEAGAICVDKSWLAGKGVKKFVAPAEFRRELIRAAENAGCIVDERKSDADTSKKRAQWLRTEAVTLIFESSVREISEAAE